MKGGSWARLGALLPLYFAVATALGFVDYQIRPHPEDGFAVYVPSVVAGTAEPPGRYRVLAPFTAAFVSRLVPLPPRENWALFRWICLFGALIAGHFYLAIWFDPTRVVLGNLLMAALLPLTFTNGWPNPDQFTELLLFTLGCWAIARNMDAVFVLLLLLNAFNRETSVFLVLLYGVARPITPAHLARTAMLGLLWAAVFVGLRWRLGYAAYDMWQLPRNINFWLRPLAANYPPYYRVFGWFFVVLIAPLAWLAASRWHEQPRFTRVAAGIVAPALFVTGFLISSVIETRIFTPMLPLLLPAALHAFPHAPSPVHAV